MEEEERGREEEEGEGEEAAERERSVLVCLIERATPSGDKFPQRSCSS